jgi:hypothetical protein
LIAASLGGAAEDRDERAVLPHVADVSGVKAMAVVGGDSGR